MTYICMCMCVCDTSQVRARGLYTSAFLTATVCRDLQATPTRSFALDSCVKPSPVRIIVRASVSESLKDESQMFSLSLSPSQQYILVGNFANKSQFFFTFVLHAEINARSFGFLGFSVRRGSAAGGERGEG